MSERTGIFIAIEGSDGSGKAVQHAKLVERLQNDGYAVATYDFPQYTQESSYFVRQYLNGAYGNLDEIGPYTASLFYALDRFEAAKAIKQDLAEGKVVLANRFMASNLAHQGSKLATPEERRGFYIWLDNLEFKLLGIPRPQLSIVLRVPAHISATLLQNRTKPSHLNKEQDIHENNLSHLRQTVTIYDELCHLFPKDYIRIDCVRNNKLMDIDTIHELIYQSIATELPEQSTASIHTNVKHTAPKLKTPISRTKDHLLLSDSRNNVVAFYPGFPTLAASALLSRMTLYGDNITDITATAAAQASYNDQNLHQNSLTSYENTRVRQLAMQPIAINTASHLMAEYMQSQPNALVFEERIFADAPNEQTAPTFHIPTQTDRGASRLFLEVMQKITTSQRTINEKLVEFAEKTSKENPFYGHQARYAATYLTPTARNSSIALSQSLDDLEALAKSCAQSRVIEINQFASALAETMQATIPSFLRHETRQNFTAISETYSPRVQTNHASTPDRPVRLLKHAPRNELSLLENTLYAQAGVSAQELQKIIDSMPFAEKSELLLGSFSAVTSQNILSDVLYDFEIVSSYGFLRFSQQNKLLKKYNRQTLSPRYGYVLPEIIEHADQTAAYESCFELSLDLHNLLQQSGLDQECEYATLLGHKVRYTATLGVSELSALIQISRANSWQELAEYTQAILDEVSLVHPLLFQYLTSAKK